MTDIVLSPDRREELLALLKNPQRLAAEFPKAAEYLNTAPMLSGTGDDRADGQFELRMIHYMTDRSSSVTNPYWATVEPSITLRNGKPTVDGGNLKGSSRLAFAQTILQDVYSYAIPSPNTLRWVQEFCDGRPILELGAGRGYWAAQLTDAGMSVAAFDVSSPEPSGNTPSVWYPVQGIDGVETFSSSTEDYVLLLCWPPGWNDPMAVEALTNFEASGGNRLIYIGEQKGGKTADDRFFAALHDRWQLSSTDTHFTSWWNLNDQAQAWMR